MARPKLYADAAAKQAAYRARKGVAVTVLLPPEVAEALSAYMARQAMDGPAATQSEVLARLIAQSIMRKR